MPSIFNGLNIAYSGLRTNQAGINVTGHNISNANAEGYTRQRLVSKASYPLHIQPGDLGSGSEVHEIIRIHDDFVYERLNRANQDKEYFGFMRQNLEELSKYFPEIDKTGLKNDLKEYFDAWASFSENPQDSSQKIILAQKVQLFARNMNQMGEKLSAMQQAANDKLKISIDEINSIGERIAKLNAQIGAVEIGVNQHANDLLDERGRLELALSKLVNTAVFKSNIKSNTPVDSGIADTSSNYNINISGFSYVDGPDFHPIKLVNDSNEDGLYSLYYERQDGYLIDMEDSLQGGKIGSILDFRGRGIDESTGSPTSGVMHKLISKLNAFSKGLIDSTNNIYARSAVSSMASNEVDFAGTTSLDAVSDYNIKVSDSESTRSFEVIMYDAQGNEKARRSVTLDITTTMEDVVSRLNENADDNDDNNLLNDFDNHFTASFVSGKLQILPNKINDGYTISIEDNGTNFAGALGLNRFLDGDDANNIDLRSDFKENNYLINAYGAQNDGDNEVANAMLQLQFEKVDFNDGFVKNEDTIVGYYDSIVTWLSSQASAVASKDETSEAQLSAIQLEYDSISKVDVDEELISLLKYQTGYSAAAKVIQAIDEMINTLLDIKR